MNVFIQEYRLMGDDGDMWGTCASWAFALCDYLTDNALMSDEEFWEFKQSSMGSDTEDIYYNIITEMIENKHATIDDLKFFSKVLQKYYTLLKNAGLDY